MSFTEIRNTIIFKYEEDITYWWRLLGEMFEGTNGFTKAYKLEFVMLNGKLCDISWNDYSWDIDFK